MYNDYRAFYYIIVCVSASYVRKDPKNRRRFLSVHFKFPNVKHWYLHPGNRHNDEEVKKKKLLNRIPPQFGRYNIGGQERNNGTMRNCVLQFGKDELTGSQRGPGILKSAQGKSLPYKSLGSRKNHLQKKSCQPFKAGVKNHLKFAPISYFSKNRHILRASHQIVTGVVYLDSDSLSTLEIDPGHFSKPWIPLPVQIQ